MPWYQNDDSGLTAYKLFTQLKCNGCHIQNRSFMLELVGLKISQPWQYMQGHWFKRNLQRKWLLPSNPVAKHLLLNPSYVFIRRQGEAHTAVFWQG